MDSKEAAAFGVVDAVKGVGQKAVSTPVGKVLKGAWNHPIATAGVAAGATAVKEEAQNEQQKYAANIGEAANKVKNIVKGVTAKPKEYISQVNYARQTGNAMGDLFTGEPHAGDKALAKKFIPVGTGAAGLAGGAAIANSMNNDEQQKTAADGPELLGDALHAVGLGKELKEPFEEDDDMNNQNQTAKQAFLNGYMAAVADGAPDDGSMDMLQIIQENIEGEYDAISKYEESLERIPDGPVHEQIASILQEEKVHVGELTTLLEQLDNGTAQGNDDGEKEVRDLQDKAYTAGVMEGIQRFAMMMPEVLGDKSPNDLEQMMREHNETLTERALRNGVKCEDEFSGGRTAGIGSALSNIGSAFKGVASGAGKAVNQGATDAVSKGLNNVADATSGATSGIGSSINNAATNVATNVANKGITNNQVAAGSALGGAAAAGGIGAAVNNNNNNQKTSAVQQPAQRQPQPSMTGDVGQAVGASGQSPQSQQTQQQPQQQQESQADNVDEYNYGAKQ